MPEMQIDNDKTMRAMFEWMAKLRLATGLGSHWTIPGRTISTIRATVDVTALLSTRIGVNNRAMLLNDCATVPCCQYTRY